MFLFASLPSEGRIIAEKTTACAELARHWQFYVSKTRTLKKVFVSIKGAYYQAEVMGEPITWLVPHQFTQSIPREVDVRVMLTFLEFYEVFLRFVLFKLFHLQGMVYPPRVDKKMDEAGSCLLALRVGEMNGKANTDIKDSSSTLESTAAVNASTSTKFSESVQMKESKQRISSLPDVLENMEDDNDDLELGLLAKPLGDALKGLQSLDGEDIDGVNEDEKIKFSIQNPQSGLFSKLVVFINREVPLEWLQFSVLSFGGRVGWAGEGSPIDVSDPRVTHQIVDRPMKNSVVNNRELVQPQWIFDCINAKLLLPVHNYRPGATLPPHLSPFVDDDSEGYLPQYREELLKLTGEIPATSGVGKDHSGIDEDSAEDETSDYTKRKMTKAPSTDDATLKKKHSKVSGGATQKGPKGIVAINSESEKTEVSIHSFCCYWIVLKGIAASRHFYLDAQRCVSSVSVRQ